MKHNFINLTAIILISMSTVGCTAARLTEFRTTARTETRRTTQLNRRDFRLGFNTTGNQLGVQLQYLPYYKGEQRKVMEYHPKLKALDWGVGLASIGLLYWINRPTENQVWDGTYAVRVDGELIKNTKFDIWSGKEQWEKTALIGIPVDWMLSWILLRDWRIGQSWEPSEIVGTWQDQENYRYRIELPTYNFSKTYKTTSGAERIELSEFLTGIDIDDLVSLLESDTFALRASAEFDGKQYEKNITVETQSSLESLRDLANAEFDMISTGTPRLMPRAEAVVRWTRDTMQAGDTATLNVTVKNTGKGELYRVTGITMSSNPIFNNRELKFGKILPGESRTLQILFKIDKLMKTRDISLRLRFGEYNDYAPADIEAKLHVVGKERPKFDYTYRVVDGGTATSVGNGDGILQRGESVDILVTVHNSSEVLAEGVTAQLIVKNASDIIMYSDSSVKLNSIVPGTSKTATFNVGIKPKSSLTTLPLDLFVTEVNFGAETELSDRINLEIQ